MAVAATIAKDRQPMESQQPQKCVVRVGLAAEIVHWGATEVAQKVNALSRRTCILKHSSKFLAAQRPTHREAIESGNEYHGHHEYHEQNHNRHGRSPDAESHESHDSHESAEHEYQLYVQEQQHAADHSSEYENSELNAGSSSSSSSIESVWNDNKMPPVKHKQYYKYSHSPPLPAAYETPSSPLSAYPSNYRRASGLYAYPSLSGPYTAPPSPGSYNNNPWYWQTPHYSPYYSDPRSNAGIYPTAYTGIYAAANPSAYPAAYPSTYPSVIVAPATRSNPNPYYDTTSSSYLDITPSAYSSITHNTQPSGDTSSYTGVESPIHMEISTSNLETANTKPYKQVKARTDMSLKAKKQVVGNLHASSKQKSKRPTRAHPLIEHNSETQSPITRRPTKVKRDEQASNQIHMQDRQLLREWLPTLSISTK
ncbi:unnamed protein product [Ceratitis capitata]|uniref:(Mediterranean fruit fly) hypothetical protein n=1 Tax=Ceratitis capitata TaxID=7213 RepID=A0A811VCM3_CERCA|nr:unnamed protein product [Ceratitis capitata]